MPLTWSRIRALNAVFDTGSFSAAGRRLGISQSAVTQQIRELEAEHGVALFERRGNVMVATALCAKLVAVTGRILHAEREAEAILLSAKSEIGGSLRIGLGNAMPGLRIAAHLRRAVPQLELDIEMGTWASIIDGVLDHRLDVGILPNVPADGRFRRETCLTQRVVAVAHASGPFAGRSHVSCEDLLTHQLIFRRQPSSTQTEVDRAFSSAKLSPKNVLTLASRDGVLEAVASGMGVGFMWEAASIRTGDMVKLSVKEIGTASPEHIFCLAGSRSRAVELFFACAGAPLDRDPWTLPATSAGTASRARPREQSDV